MSTTVNVQSIVADLAALQENTSTGEYGYYVENGLLYAEVWNDNYHGVKDVYRIRVVLEKVTYG